MSRADIEMSRLPDHLEQKRQQAIAWLRARGKYVLDRGTPPPKWSANQRKPKIGAQA